MWALTRSNTCRRSRNPELCWRRQRPTAGGNGDRNSAREFAPGQLKEPGESAKEYAPGQRKEQDENARDYAPGQKKREEIEGQRRRLNER